MTVIQEALANGSKILHRMGNALNTVLHSCYEDAGVTPEQQKKAVDELIEDFTELRKIFGTLKELIKDKGIK